MFARAVSLGLIALALTTAPAASQLSRQVTGTVTGASSKRPVAEASIVAVGANAATRTNAEGKFTLTVNAGELRLLVRAIGFVRKEVTVPTGQTTVNIELSEDIFRLEEIVTTGQATTIAKKNATTASVSVEAEDLVRAPAQSLDQALQGKVPGAQIFLNGGGPGGGAQIQIRGASSILGNSQPLFVLDGAIISNDGFSGGLNALSFATGQSGVTTSNQDAIVNRLSDINPNEIESIEVLKSAAATAIYGSRATNGVIVIKTKRGTAGATKVNFTQRIGTQSPLRLMGTRNFTTVQQVLDIPFGNGLSGKDWMNATFPSGQIPASANIDLAKQFYSNKDPSYETIASMQGGTEKFQFFSSVTNRKEVGLAPNTGAQLQAFRFNGDQKFSKYFALQLSGNITRNILNRGVSGNENNCSSPIYCMAYTPGIIDLSKKNDLGQYPINVFNGGGVGSSNWFDEFDNIKNTQSIFRQLASGTLTFTPLESQANRVVMSVTGGVDHYVQDSYILSPPFLQLEGFDGFKGRAVQSTVNGLNYNSQFNTVWTYTGIKGSSFTTSAGASLERQATNFYDILARGLLPGQTNVQQGSAPIAVTQQFQEFRDQALFANEQILTLDGKLSLNGGVRADRSSANGDRSKFYIFPRGSAAYNFGAVGPFSSLKLRGGVGKSGNRPRFGDRDLLGTPVLIGGQQGIIVPGTVGNALIKPETLTEYEGGVDLTVLKERVQLEATYYERNISDQLLNPAVAPSSGFGAVVVNAGRLKTKGVEAGLTVVPYNRGNLQWTAITSFQKNTQRVTDLPAFIPPFNPSGGNSGSTRPRIISGQVTTKIWGLTPYVNGVRQPVGYTFLRAIGSPAAPTAVRALDSIVGDANPTFQMYFNNQITWKKLTLGFSVDWRKGGDVFNFTQQILDEGGTSKDYDDAVTLDNAPRGTTAEIISAIPAGTKLGEFRLRAYQEGGRDSRVYTQDGGYVRLRDVSLSFEAPKDWARALRAGSMRFSLQGRNVLMFTKYTAFDPENVRRGSQNIRQAMDLASFPGSRQFYFSIDLGF